MTPDPPKPIDDDPDDDSTVPEPTPLYDPKPGAPPDQAPDPENPARIFSDFLLLPFPVA